MKKIVTLGAMSLGVFFLAGCGQQQTVQNKSTTSTPSAQQNTITQSQQEPLANKPFKKTKENESGLYFEGMATAKGIYTRSTDAVEFCLTPEYEYLFPEAKINWNNKRKCFNLSPDSLVLFTKKTKINTLNLRLPVFLLSE
jgi:hypothetical protein